MHFPGSECSLLRFAETNHNFRIVREFSTNNYSQVSACSTSSCKLVMVSCRSDLASSTVFLANFPSFSERWTEDRFLVWCKTGQKKALLLHRTKTRHKPNFGMSGDSSCVRAVSKLYFVHWWRTWCFHFLYSPCGHRRNQKKCDCCHKIGHLKLLFLEAVISHKIPRSPRICFQQTTGNLHHLHLLKFALE